MKVVRPAISSVFTLVLFSDRWKSFSNILEDLFLFIFFCQKVYFSMNSVKRIWALSPKIHIFIPENSQFRHFFSGRFRQRYSSSFLTMFSGISLAMGQRLALAMRSVKAIRKSMSDTICSPLMSAMVS